MSPLSSRPPEPISPAQLALIDELAAQAFSRSSYNEDIERKFKKPKEQLTARQASAFINELNTMLNRRVNRPLKRLYR